MTEAEKAKPTNPAESKPTNPAIFKAAVEEGKALIKQGKTKVEAATAIFAKLKNETREVVVAAFMEGATLTEKGAVTYWYNCRRKAKKPKLEQA